MSRFVPFLLLTIAALAARPAAAEPMRGLATVVMRNSAGTEIPLYSNSFALVVGNATYTEGYTSLPPVRVEVDLVAAALQRNGFTVRKVLDATYEQFLAELAAFSAGPGADSENRLLFYFAGHGETVMLENGVPYGSICMVDTPRADLDRIGYEKRAVSMQRIYDETQRMRARHVLCLFDSCFSGSILASRSGGDSFASDLDAVPDDVRDHLRHPVRQFITAGAADQLVPAKSVFTPAFISLIEGRDPAARRDGYLTGRELAFRLYNIVVDRSKGAQTPQDAFVDILGPGKQRGDFVFKLEGAP